MKKKIKALSLLTSACIASSVIPFVVSCNAKQQGYDIQFNFSQDVINERQFSMPFKINSNEISKLEVELSNPTSGLSLTTSEIELTDGGGAVGFAIGNEIGSGTYISFTLIFKGNDGKSDIRIEKPNFKFMFIENPIVEEDILYPQETTCTKENSHYFSYRVNFSNMPQDSTIELSVINDPAQNIILLDDHPVVQKEQFEIFIDINIQLNFAIYQSGNFDFGLCFSFTNSYGKKQVNEITNYLAIYKRKVEKRESIPFEYFNIETIDSSTVLRGFKPNVKSVDLMSYSVITIPEGVDEIMSDLETEDELFPWQKNITKIVFNSCEKLTIDQDFFEKFINLFELDLTACGDCVPWWTGSQMTYFNEDLICKTGYVWTHNSTKNWEVHHNLVDRGLPEQWAVFDDQSVTDEDFFDINEDGIIERISTDARDRISQIKVIRLPYYINGVNCDALKPLKSEPYINTSDPLNPVQETRRLILDGDFSGITSQSRQGDGVFKNIGVSGPIVVNCPNLINFQSCEFYDIGHYDVTWLDKIKSEDTTYFNIINLQNISNINDFAFAFSNLSNFTGNTQSLTKIDSIGNFAFYCNKFKSVSFGFIEDVGNLAFADTYNSKPNATIGTINLEAFNKIINPEEPSEQKRTRVPSWWTTASYVFKGAVSTSEEQSRVIWMDASIQNEVEEKHEKWPETFPTLDEWEEETKKNLGLGSDWSIHFQ